MAASERRRRLERSTRTGWTHPHRTARRIRYPGICSRRGLWRFPDRAKALSAFHLLDPRAPAVVEPWLRRPERNCTIAQTRTVSDPSSFVGRWDCFPRSAEHYSTLRRRRTRISTAVGSTRLSLAPMAIFLVCEEIQISIRSTMEEQRI